MVDSITTKSITQDAVRVVAAAPVAAPAPVTGATSPATPAPVDIAQAGGLARAMASSAPVDTDRVATIRKAIAEGRFPMLPATIADRLIALKLHWNPDEPEHEPERDKT